MRSTGDDDHAHPRRDQLGEQSADALAALVRSVENLPPDVVAAALGELTDEDDDPPFVGPVRLPDERTRREAIRTAPALRRLRQLAEYCRRPGRPLTGGGNLRLADARELVVVLGTGDDPEQGGGQRVQSAADLPGLSWLVRLAHEAGVVRRQQGRLVTVGRFAELDETVAYERVVRAAVAIGLSGPDGLHLPAAEQLREETDACLVGLLADLLDAGPDGLPRETAVDGVVEFVDEAFDGLPDLLIDLVRGWVRTQLERLEELGVVSSSGGTVTLTPAGVPVAVELVRDDGAEVLVRPDPATCDAAALVGLLGLVDAPEWAADASTWLRTRPDPAVATGELIDEVCAEGRDPVVVVAGLAAVSELVGEDVLPAVRRRLGGPHDGLVLYWLAERSAIDPSTVDPLRFMAGLVDILAVALDVDGPEPMVDIFGDAEQDQQLDILGHIWRLDHPRLPEVLDALGSHHPVKRIAKAARKARMQHQGRSAGPVGPR